MHNLVGNALVLDYKRLAKSVLKEIKSVVKANESIGLKFCTELVLAKIADNAAAGLWRELNIGSCDRTANLIKQQCCIAMALTNLTNKHPNLLTEGWFSIKDLTDLITACADKSLLYSVITTIVEDKYKEKRQLGREATAQLVYDKKNLHDLLDSVWPLYDVNDAGMVDKHAKHLTTTINSLNAIMHLEDDLLVELTKNEFTLWTIHYYDSLCLLKNEGDYRLLEWKEQNYKNGVYQKSKDLYITPWPVHLDQF